MYKTVVQHMINRTVRLKDLALALDSGKYYNDTFTLLLTNHNLQFRTAEVIV